MSTHTSWVQKLFAAESSPLSRFSAENTLIAGHDCNIQRIQKAKVEKLSNSTVHHTLGFKREKLLMVPLLHTPKQSESLGQLLTQ